MPRGRRLTHPKRTDGHKTCTRCDVTKPVGQFSTRAAGHDGLNHWCRLCAGDAQRHRKYGLTRADLDALIEAQLGLCAICGKAWEVIDHCHTTGEVRGLLCHGCNIALGGMQDEPSRLRAAAVYLEGVS